jgi:hypothetical protein
VEKGGRRSPGNGLLRRVKEGRGEERSEAFLIARLRT